MKRKLSFKQWAVSLVLFAGFCAVTLSCYLHSHADAGFEAFAEAFFLEELQANPIHFHYSIDDPGAYQIEEAALTMPVYHAGDAVHDAYALSLVSGRLDDYDPAALSDENRRLHGLLCSYIESLRRTAAYPYFSEPLSPAGGAPSELPILLAEYRIDTAEDIALYLSILEQIPDYFAGLIVYEQEKAAAGLFMSDSAADKVIRQCTALMDCEQLENHTHFLEVTFKERLQALTGRGLITGEESLAYQSENNRLLTTVVAPAYDRLADELTLLKGSGRDTCGLACRAGGREYYEALLRLQTGSCRDIASIRQLLYDDLRTNYEALGRLLAGNDALRGDLLHGKALLPDLTPEEMLSYLKESMRDAYPAIPAAQGASGIGCTVKYVDDSLEPYTAPAFYMTPPIDNVRSNAIYINAADTDDDLSLFTTLAHEGYPGHLYQTVYSQNVWACARATPFRSVLYYGGYVEGWAMYAELSSYDYAVRLAGDAHPEAADYYLACRLDRQIQLCLYSLLDIAIHYDGAALEDVREILSSLGTPDDDTVEAIYAYIAEEPCNYPKYYLGYLEMMELKKQAAGVWRNNRRTAGDPGDMTIDAVDHDPDFLYFFHSFVLENGPADFQTLSRLLADRVS